MAKKRITLSDKLAELERQLAAAQGKPAESAESTEDEDEVLQCTWKRLELLIPMARTRDTMLDDAADIVSSWSRLPEAAKEVDFGEMTKDQVQDALLLREAVKDAEFSLGELTLAMWRKGLVSLNASTSEVLSAVGRLVS